MDVIFYVFYTFSKNKSYAHTHIITYHTHTDLSPEHPSHLRTESPSLKYPLHLKKEDYIIM